MPSKKKAAPPPAAAEQVLKQAEEEDKAFIDSLTLPEEKGETSDSPPNATADIS